MRSPITGLVALILGLCLVPGGRAEEPKLPEGVEVLARGPIHEAFAQPATEYKISTITVDRQPPDPLDEVPPAQKPEGDGVIWVPGYWQWDEERGDFIWVSGTWRNAPPNRVWVPGGWRKVGDRWQWSPGYWAQGDSGDTTYLPPPPDPQETGPVGEAPGPDYIWVPGCWVYRDRYVWRPGFWLRCPLGWVWTPCQYIWTPAGYLYCRGYWDYTLADRGLLFAPCWIPRSVWGRPRFAWTPSLVVNIGFLPGALFVRAPYRHYWYGDYFSPRYVRGGYIPWTDYTWARGAYDPLYGYYRRANLREGNWDRNLRDLYTARYLGSATTPPRTLTQQATLLNRIEQRSVTNVRNANDVTVLRTLNQVQNQGNLRLARVDQAAREQERQRAAQLRTLAERQREAERDLLRRQVAPVRSNATPQRVTAPRPQIEPPRRESPRTTQPQTQPRPQTPPPQQPRPQTPPVTQPRPRETPPTPRINPPRQEPPRPRQNVTQPRPVTPTPPPQTQPRRESPPPRPVQTQPPAQPRREAPRTAPTPPPAQPRRESPPPRPVQTQPPAQPRREVPRTAPTPPPQRVQPRSEAPRFQRPQASPPRSSAPPPRQSAPARPNRPGKR